MFKKTKELYCESCSKINKKDYDLVMTHIRENPGATTMDVISATGVTLKSINCFIEDGSISYAKNPEGEVIALPQEDENKGVKFHTRRR